MLKERLLYKEIEPFLGSKEAIIITGMRRVGKTSLLRFIFDGIQSQNKLFLDLENPLNQKYFGEENYEKIKAQLQILGLNFTRQAYLFLDEVQLLKNLPSVVKFLIDHYNVKCFLTGSASYYLKNLFSESLAGRKYLFELFPLTFKEFLTFKESKVSLPDESRSISKPIFDTVSPLYDEYFLFGGFPEVVLKTSVGEKKKALEDIFTSFFQMEVLRLGDFKKNDTVRDLMLLLMERVGSKLDIQKLSKELAITRPTLYEYISFLEGTYFIKTIKPFTTDRGIEIRKMPKVYLCDSGLINQFARTGEGALFENSVFQNLRIKGEVDYYQRKGGSEIDFILDKRQAFEVKTKPYESDINKLKKLAFELNLKEFKIISKRYSNLDNLVYGFML